MLCRTAIFVLCLSSAISAAPIRVMTYNILAEQFEHSGFDWDHPTDPRSHHVGQLIVQQEPELLGLQEVTEGQLSDLMPYVPDYGMVRPPTRSFFNVVFYDSERFAERDSGRIQLNESRDFVWAELEEIATGKRVRFGTTHLEAGANAEGQASRQQDIQLIVSDLPTDLALITAADWNMELSDPSWRLLYNAPLSLVDACDAFCAGEPTFLGVRQLDYVHTDSGVVHDARVIYDSVDGFAPSDHNPVVAQISVPEPSLCLASLLLCLGLAGRWRRGRVTTA